MVYRARKNGLQNVIKHHPSRSGQTSLATAVANFTKPRTSHFFNLCTCLVVATSFTASRASKASTWATDPMSEMPSAEPSIFGTGCNGSSFPSFNRNRPILIYISLLTIGPFQYSAWASSPVRLSWFLSSVAGEAGMHMAHRNIKEHVQHLVILSVWLLVRGRLLRS